MASKFCRFLFCFIHLKENEAVDDMVRSSRCCSYEINAIFVSSLKVHGVNGLRNISFR